jgi:hypothetical protein
VSAYRTAEAEPKPKPAPYRLDWPLVAASVIFVLALLAPPVGCFALRRAAPGSDSAFVLGLCWFLLIGEILAAVGWAAVTISTTLDGTRRR